jgi:parallel beta-helix repeat protein
VTAISHSILLPAILLSIAALSGSDARTLHVSDIQHLVQACGEAVAGDEIVIAPGTYTLKDRTRIAIQNRTGPVTVRGESGKSADIIIEGQGQDNESVQTVFDLTDSPDWTFRDLTTRATYYHGFKFNGASSGCMLSNVTMRDHGESGVKGTSDPKSDRHPDRLLMDRCDIGFTIPAGGTREVVEGVDGVAVKGWIIRNCRFINIQKHGDPAYGVFTKGNSAETLIEKNRFENCFIGASFGGGGTGPDYFRDQDQTFEHRGGKISGNTFLHCTDAAIYINKGTDCEISGNNMTDCAANIQLRYPQSSARVLNNRVQSEGEEPIIRVRDRASVLADQGNSRTKDP